MNTAANNKVYDLNQQAMKYLETLALLYANFEQICTEKREVEEQFERDFEEALRKPCTMCQGCADLRLDRRGLE